MRRFCDRLSDDGFELLIVRLLPDVRYDEVVSINDQPFAAICAKDHVVRDVIVTLVAVNHLLKQLQ